MRSIVSVGLLGGFAGVIGLISVTWLSRNGSARDSTLEASIRASLERAELLWHASCPVKELDGACLQLAAESPTRALPTHCGAGSRRAWTAVPRDARKKAAALAVFDDVIARLGVWVPAAVGRSELRYDLGLARFYEGDALREAALAIPPPTELRLDAWLKTRAAARDRAAATYAEVLAAGDTKTSVAATARSAQVAADFVDELFALEIPSCVQTGELAADRIDAYCDALTVAAEPAVAGVVDKYAACFTKASELGSFPEWSSLCESALEQLDPVTYPTLGELRRGLELDGTPFAITADNFSNGLYYAHFGALDAALHSFAAAVVEDPSAIAPRIDGGLLALQLRRYELAKRLFAEAVELAPATYDALIGLGIAQRAVGDLDGAEVSYARARDLNPRRGDAYYDLAILYKDFRASSASDPDPAAALRRQREMYERARGLFVQYLERALPSDRTDARASIGDCDKAMQQIDAFEAH